MGQIYKDLNHFFSDHQALFWLVAVLLGIGYVTWDKVFHRLLFTLFRPIKTATANMTALTIRLEGAILAIRKSSRLVLRLEANSTGYFIVTLLCLALAAIAAIPPFFASPPGGEMVPPVPSSIGYLLIILVFLLFVLIQFARFNTARDIEKCVIGDLTKPRLMLKKAKAVAVKYGDANSKQVTELSKACTRVEQLLKEIEEIAEAPLPGEEVPSG